MTLKGNAFSYFFLVLNTFLQYDSQKSPYNSFIFFSIMHYFSIAILTTLPQMQGLKITQIYVTVLSGIGLTKLRLKCLQVLFLSGGRRGQSHSVS